MSRPESPEPLSLFGGPLRELGRRIGLVHGDSAIRFGLVLGLGLWLIVVALAFAQGRAAQILSLSVIAGHARLLLVIPLFFMAESWVAPRMGAFVNRILRTGIAQEDRLSVEISRANRLANAWWPEAACLIAAIALLVIGAPLRTHGTTGDYDPSRNWLAGLAYYRVGVTMFRFLLFRWGWKLVLWGWFLWRVSRLELRLIPGHPDRAGGLGSLGGVHERFTPLVLALSILEAASLAESISTGTLSTTGIYSWLAMVLVIDVVLFLCPLLVFADKLLASRANGVQRYSELAARYVSEFEAKWTGGNAVDGEPLLGTPDIQSLADLSNAFASVRAMRWIPAGPRLLTILAIGAVAPFPPLLLFQYPLAELTQKFFSRLIGL